MAFEPMDALTFELVREESYASAIARLNALASEHPSGACAFDGDGTLWSGDVGEDYLEHLLAEDAFTDVAKDLFAQEAARFGVAKAPKARDQLASLFRAYTEGTYAEERICGLIALAVAGRSSSEVARVGEDVVRLTDVRARLHEETTGILEESKRLGLTPFLVSASPRAVVVAAAACVGLDPDEVIAVTPREEAGRVTATLVEPIPYGEGKATLLLQRIGARPLLACAGDNVFDLAMLKKAHLPLAIRPKSRLRAVAHELPELVVLGSR